MTGNAEQIVKWLFTQDRDKVFEVKEYKEKRSLNANSYAWALMTKIADALRTSKNEIYLQMLEDYGQTLLIPVEVGKQPDGFFKYYKFITTSQINGKDADWYKVFKGSSDFDSKEMAILIDGIISEAKELGIETLPPADIERLKERWNEQEHKSNT